MLRLILSGMLVVVGIFATQIPATASILDAGDLTIIDSPGNPSDGLRFIDVTISQGLTAPDALSNAQAVYANARFATPAEFDDLFSAAGITSDGGNVPPSAGFLLGGTEFVSVGGDYDGGVLSLLLGITFQNVTAIWTLPDGDPDINTTRDLIALDPLSAIVTTLSETPPSSNVGWLLVSASSPPASVIPEPSSVLCWLGLGLVGWMKLPRRRKTL